MSGRFLIGACATVFLLTLTVTTQDRFPEGAGKSELIKVCSGCHEPDNVFAYPQTASEWSETLKNMAQRGTEATDEEWTAIEQYLHKYVAIIPVNTAQSTDLVRTMDIAPVTAEAIVEYRKSHGKFMSAMDLKKVPGLDETKVDARRDRLVF